jgi:hypothetical protein
MPYGPVTSCLMHSAADQQLNCLTVIDEYTRECLAIDVTAKHPLQPGDRNTRQTHKHRRMMVQTHSLKTKDGFSRSINDEKSSHCNHNTHTQRNPP